MREEELKHSYAPAINDKSRKIADKSPLRQFVDQNSSASAALDTNSALSQSQ